MEFEGKVVIVTGSGKGIGRCIAQTYAAKGALVVIAEKDTASGQETEKLIVSDGGNAIFIKTDVTSPDEITEMVRKTAEMFGTIDILINNTGISKWESPYDLSVDEWDKVINTNLRSAFLCSREAAKIMKMHGGGSIVNISSTRAFMSYG